MVQILESELEDYIFENYKKLDWLGVDFLYRQVNLIGYGIIDLLGIKKWKDDIVFTIIELKKDNIGYSALGQLNRYIIGLKRNLKELDIVKKIEEENDNIFSPVSIKGLLIGNSLDSGDICYTLECLNENISRVEYKINLENGIEFEQLSDYGWYNEGEKINLDLNKMIEKVIKNNQNGKK